MKQIFLKILFLLCAIITLSCFGDDVDIQNNRRLLVKGKITDTQGKALPNISVITSSLGDVLGQTSTDASGNFKLVSLDEQFDPLDIFINVDNFFIQDINYSYSSNAYYSPEKVDRVLYDLGTIVLGKRAILNFTFTNNPGDQNTLSYELIFTPSDCELPINVTDPPENCNLSESYSEFLTPSSENQTISINSIQGEDVIFKYSLNGNPTQTIEITLTNEENTYVFEY